MKIRRSILPMFLLLLLLVLVAQQAAYVLVLSHVPGEDHALQLDADHAADGDCPACLAFAAGAGPMLGGDKGPATAAAGDVLAPRVGALSRGNANQSYRARAPPRQP